MARAYVEIDEIALSLEEYENLYLPEAKEELIEHPLGFHYPARFGHKDENGAVI